MRLSLLALLLLATACASATVSSSPPTSAPTQTSSSTSAAITPMTLVESTVLPDEQREVIPLSLALYIVSDASGDEANSSVRTVAEVESIASRVNEIWSQADVLFDPITVHEVSLPTDILEPIITSGNTGPFFDQAGRGFDLPAPAIINGFFLSEAFGVNGFAPSQSRVFFVVDQPTVHDERVTSHEIGHIFGLHHDLADPGQLMFSGTNGTGLSEQEQTVARYGIEGILNAR